MAKTPSTMVPLGTPAPDFSLPDVKTGETVTLASTAGRPLLMMFICNHCPFVIHILDELDRLDQDYAEKVSIVAISANSVKTHPEDSPDRMRALAAERGWSFPYCYDETQEVARAYSAACTPDFFLYCVDRNLFYRGQLDETRPGGPPPHGRDLRAALDAVLAGGSPPSEQLASMGCNIKWHP